VLAFPYLAVRETSRGTDLAATNPAAALAALHTATELNPLTAIPDRLAGTIALQSGMPNAALERFRQATDRDPGGWFAWYGAGLAASALGDPTTAAADFRVAHSIDRRQPAIALALSRVNTDHPLTPQAGLRLLRFAQ
jgi:tetratricopeptide (TPR) repeat protein